MHYHALSTTAILLALLSPAAAASKQAVVDHYAHLVHISYTDSLTKAKELKSAITALTTTPSQESLEAARSAWLAAREPYGQTEAYRFYAGPIDDDNGPEGLLNAWPLDEQYIDYTKDAAGSGIIANQKDFPNITSSLLRELNEKEGDANISTGYHAIEFLLWGQDLSKDGPGARPVSDYTSDALAARRKEYLTVVTDMLIEDLTYLVMAWKPNSKNYRKQFVSETNASLGKIIIGMGSLAGGELAGERMAVALENKDQEDEHSCFSDNTHRDIVTNVVGINNIWLGTYTDTNGKTTSGASLKDLLSKTNPDLAKVISTSLAESVQKTQAIQAPFDQEIISEAGRARVQAAIKALWHSTRLLPQLAKELKVDASIDGL